MVVERFLKMGTARSRIREQFEYGMAQAAIVGKENVYDFSIGNPSVPTPAAVADTVRELERIGIPCEPIRQDAFTGKPMTFFRDPDDLPLELHE